MVWPSSDINSSSFYLLDAITNIGSLYIGAKID